MKHVSIWRYMLSPKNGYVWGFITALLIITGFVYLFGFRWR